ncbi:YegS/Rv2252/BmrU family lipid kinase [Nibrella saemangeumensis]|uniref:YegS/Rv2252/BmrU family lipid kinase n=1 Tax=Nibrella saemangeumensis TaxID=1084526 RepID=A0ABP8NGF8_9BACT
MQDSRKLKLLFAINPVSGGQSKETWEESIKTYCADKPHELNLLILNGEDDEERLTKEIDAYKPDRVVAVGGDGTVKMVAEQLLSKNIPLGILPAGSANGMARDLDLPADPEQALDVIVNGRVQPVDLICVNDKDLCLHLSDIGLNAQLVKYYHENNWRGKLGYARGVLRVLLNKRPMTVEISTTKGVLRREAFMVALANARMYGTGAIINPDGDVSDGYFEVVIIRQFSWFEFLKMFWRYRPFDPKKIEVLQAKALIIETRKRAYFQIDGEYRGRIKRLEARIMPGGLKVMLPQEKKGE